MSRVWSFLRRHGFDLLILAAALEATLEVAFRDDANAAPRATLWFTVPAIAVLVLTLLSRRRFPFASPAGLWLLAAVLSFADGRLVTFTIGAYVAGLAAALLLGNLDDARRARLGLGIVVASAAIVVYNDPTHAAGEVVFIPLLFAIGWLGGYALRERAERAAAAELRATQAERERDAAARIAVAEERTRIARELHDIVAHAVSVMVLQVGAVRHRHADALGDDGDALRGVEQTGRMALEEMRRLLGAMRSDGEDDRAPQPGLGSVDSLVAEVTRAGLPVRLHVEGDPRALPQAIDLSAYRIVQEGLTNALKHADASHADVTVRYGRGDLEIDVRDDGKGASSTNGSGHGLVGIRERVTIFGGELRTGPAPGGGFRLSARLPLDGQRA
jgi:signal transduction histidine kinase